MAGGLVTSHGAGLAVPDWPNTYGYNMFLFPISQWVGGIFYEHTHRLIAATVGLLTTILAGWLWARETRGRAKWLGLAAIAAVIAIMGIRRLPVYVSLAAAALVVIGFSVRRVLRRPAELRWWGLLAFAAVILQGVLGGLRVVLLQDAIGIFHAALAQLFFALTCALGLLTSRRWMAAAKDLCPERGCVPGTTRSASADEPSKDISIDEQSRPERGCVRPVGRGLLVEGGSTTRSASADEPSRDISIDEQSRPERGCVPGTTRSVPPAEKARDASLDKQYPPAATGPADTVALRRGLVLFRDWRQQTVPGTTRSVPPAEPATDVSLDKQYPPAATGPADTVALRRESVLFPDWRQQTAQGGTVALRWRRVLIATTALIFLQLVIGAAMRHQHAGLAIPDFPLAYGRIWPATDAASVAFYNQHRLEVTAVNPITAFQIVLQMVHRLVALSILAAVGYCAWRMRKLHVAGLAPKAGGEFLRRGTLVWLGLIGVQALLGAATIWSGKAADVATAHVLVGALSLATGVILSLQSAKSAVVDQTADEPVAARAAWTTPLLSAPAAATGIK